MSSPHTSRRQLLTQSAAAAVGVAFASSAKGANDRLSIGIIVYAKKATGSGGAGNDKLKEDLPIPKKAGTPHMKNWLGCIRSPETPNADLDAGYQHSVACIIAAQAYETGKRLVFDVEKREIREG